MVNNTFINERRSGVFLRNFSDRPAYVYNNFFTGAGTPLVGPALQVGNLHRAQGSWWQSLQTLLPTDGAADRPVPVHGPQLLAPAKDDFTPRRASALVDARAALDRVDGMSLSPTHEYRHPRGGQPRPKINRIDVGAYERR